MNFSQNLFDFENSVKFANYLYKAQDYKLAAREFERITFMNPGIDSLEFKLVKSLQLSNNFSKAINRVENIYPQFENIPPQIAFEYTKTLILNNDFIKSQSFLQSKNKLSDENTELYNISMLLLTDNFKKADSMLNVTKYNNNEFLIKYKEITNEALNARFKKNWLGVGMSVLVPGTGKVYAGYWKDGLISALMFGVSAFQSYRGFEKSGINSGYGWMFGSISFGFYLGNIYGTNKAINKKNKEKLHRVHTKIKNTFNSIH